MGSCQDNNSAQPDLGAVGLNPSPQNSLAFEFRNSVVYCRVGQLCLPSYPQQIPWAMLLHGPQDRDVFFVKKRNYSVYVVKVVIGANCAQGGPEKGGILCPFNPFKPTRVVPLERVGLDSFDWDDAHTNKVRGARQVA